MLEINLNGAEVTTNEKLNTKNKKLVVARPRLLMAIYVDCVSVWLHCLF
jgi:hypothetical protein